MKKNLQKIPKLITAKLEGITSDEVIVATTIGISQRDITDQKYPALGLNLIENELSFNSPSVPDKDIGKYCKRNLDGKEITRKDLPKVLKTFYMGERPVYGDWSNGSFDLHVNRQVYQKEIEQPKNYELSIQLLKEEVVDSENYFIFKVWINQSLNKVSESFSDDLLYQLNILQESIGRVSIFAADAEDEEFLKIKTINWEIFPPGERDQDLVKILGRFRKVTLETREKLSEKYDLLVSLNPQELIVGVSGLRGYFGAKFNNNLVVFENLNYGNAIYVLYQEWEELSKLSRTQILARPKDEFERISHRTGWEKKLTSLIKKKTA